MHRIRAADERNPWVLDGGLAILLAVMSLSAVVGAGSGIVGALWFAVLHAPLVWRRRAPVVVFWAVAGLVGTGTAFSLARYDRGLFPEAIVLVALYTVARYRSRRHLWPAIAAVEGSLMVLLLLPGPRWGTLAAASAVPAATVLLGLTISTRRAYLAALEERARRLERERDQLAQLAVAAERARIAREMHDIVAHNVAVMVALADGAALTATATPQRAAEVMRQVSDTGRQALGEMRRLLGLLRDGREPSAAASAALSATASSAPLSAATPSAESSRAPQPGLADIDRLVEQVRAAGPRVALTIDGVPGRWGAGAGLTVYRIVQEALTNTLKHAGPDADVRIRLHYAADGVDLEVTDDGGGRAMHAVAGGHGLTGMIERAAPYGGSVVAGPNPGATGWHVRATLRFGDSATPGEATAGGGTERGRGAG